MSENNSYYTEMLAQGAPPFSEEIYKVFEAAEYSYKDITTVLNLSGGFRTRFLPAAASASKNHEEARVLVAVFTKKIANAGDPSGILTNPRLSVSFFNILTQLTENHVQDKIRNTSHVHSRSLSNNIKPGWYYREFKKDLEELEESVDLFGLQEQKTLKSIEELLNKNPKVWSLVHFKAVDSGYEDFADLFTA